MSCPRGTIVDVTRRDPPRVDAREPCRRRGSVPLDRRRLDCQAVRQTMHGFARSSGGSAASSRIGAAPLGPTRHVLLLDETAEKSISPDAIGSSTETRSECGRSEGLRERVEANQSRRNGPANQRPDFFSSLRRREHSRFRSGCGASSDRPLGMDEEHPRHQALRPGVLHRHRVRALTSRAAFPLTASVRGGRVRLYGGGARIQPESRRPLTRLVPLRDCSVADAGACCARVGDVWRLHAVAVRRLRSAKQRDFDGGEVALALHVGTAAASAA
jgi:hypothetical protein